MNIENIIIGRNKSEIKQFKAENIDINQKMSGFWRSKVTRIEAVKK